MPEWTNGLFEVSPIVVGTIVAVAIVGSLAFLFMLELRGRR